MVREIDAGMTEEIRQELRNDSGGFDASTFNVELDLLQIGGASWAPATTYAVGALTRPTEGNGRIYRCRTAGTSASTEPLWPTAHGGLVTDGTVEWEDISPTVAWYVQAVGQVVITNYHRLPRDTSYRVRYLVTDTFGNVGPFPNFNKYDVWRVGAVMAG
jgi:hypothetical protein